MPGPWPPVAIRATRVADRVLPCQREGRGVAPRVAISQQQVAGLAQTGDLMFVFLPQRRCRGRRRSSGQRGGSLPKAASIAVVSSSSETSSAAIASSRVIAVLVLVGLGQSIVNGVRSATPRLHVGWPSGILLTSNDRSPPFGNPNGIKNE